jgi:putative ABC transport system ATP-binding protein
MNIIALKEVEKTYSTGKLHVPVLHGVTLEITKGEMVAIMGPSGSGKSTLMNMIGLLDRPSAGSLEIAGEPVTLTMADSKLAKLRSEKIGFVFQSFNLLPRATTLSNVLMPTMYTSAGRQTERAIELLTKLGLKDRIYHKPTELSGGEKQRVAIARALINDPEIILADEPTGNLDTKSGGEVMDILQDLHKEGKTIIVITHDAAVAKRCERIIFIRDGIVEKNHA